jgi:nucleoside-diphosphate-sugar epimerase
MKIVVVGASGNVGTSVLRSLSRDPAVDSILGIARRLPELHEPKTEWAQADISRDELAPLFRGADVVIDLAWLIQPGRDLATLRATNVDGRERVFEAVAAAGVPGLIYASSVGTYSPGPKDRLVDESWPAGGIESSFYSRHKAEVERMLDRYEREHPSTRVVRLRPALIFRREAASGIRRLFVGPLLASPLLRRGLIPVVPSTPRLCFQAVHADDVGEAYRIAALSDARGPFNIAAEPVIDSAVLAELLGARRVPLPASVLRTGAQVSFKLRLQPSEPGWVDMALAVPLMDVSRARTELGWEPLHSARDAFLELLDGIRDGAGIETPPLAPDSGGPLRLRELLTGVGKRAGL